MADEASGPDRVPATPDGPPGAAGPIPGGPPRAAAAQRLHPGGGSHPALDRLAALAARLLASPSAQVSLLTHEQTVAGGAGLPEGSVGGRGPLADSLCTVTAAAGGPLIVGDARVDDRVASLPPVASGQVGSYLGVPLAGPDGYAVGALCVYDAQPRTWSEEDVALLDQLARSVVAELELSAVSTELQTSRVQWGLAIDAAGIGSFDWDLTSGELRWDDRLKVLFGYDEASFAGTIDAFLARLHPDDREAVDGAVRAAVADGTVYDGEYRVLLPDGEVRWLAARGRVLRDESGEPVRMVGAVYDMTGLRAGEARVARVLETMPAAFYSLDRDWRFTYVNAEAELLLRRPREELLGGVIWELFPAAVGSDFEVQYRKALDSGSPVSFDAYYPAPLDGWYEIRVWPSPEGLAVYFLEVTQRKRAQEAAERARQRAELLAEVSAELAGTLDSEEAMAKLARLVVPGLADWSLVTLVDDDGSLRDVGSFHRDPALRGTTADYATRRLSALTPESFVTQALRTAEPVVLPQDALAEVSAVLEPGPARDLLARLAPESFAVVPLRGRGRTVGLLTLFRGPGSRPLDDEDVTSARDVAARAGLALDTARLYRQQRQLAESLQRSLLTEPPEHDRVEVVVRYEPASEVARVGGDWYDAFVQPDGATVIVIGDVVGHDTEAAAAMGQVRGLLRGIAFTSGDGPAGVLTRLDAAMEGLDVGTTATAVVARVEQRTDERERDITHVRWSNAGHPPPMVINPDGSVAVLAAAGEADLLLGIDPATPRVESEVVLDHGSTILLYTDGLVERRGQGIDTGLDRLRETLLEVAAEPLDTLAGAVLDRLLPERREDDVALVAVRLHPQRRRRPD